MTLQLLSAFETAAAWEIPVDEAEEEIREEVVRQGSKPDDHQIWLARETYFSAPWGRSRRREKYQPVGSGDFAEIVHESFDFFAPEIILQRASIVDPRKADLQTILGALYAPGEKVLIFRSKKGQGSCLYEIGDQVPDELPTQSEEGPQFIINPVDGDYHLSGKRGKRSRRGVAAVTSFRYILLRTRSFYYTEWLKSLIMLPLPIAAIYRSGRNSIHALLRVDASSKSDFAAVRARLLPILDTIGADCDVTGAAQLSWLPTAYRGEIEQELLYLNPSPTSRGILFGRQK